MPLLTAVQIGFCLWDLTEEENPFFKPFPLDLSMKLLERLDHRSYGSPEPADYYCSIAPDSKDVGAKGREDQPTEKTPHWPQTYLPGLSD